MGCSDKTPPDFGGCGPEMRNTIDKIIIVSDDAGPEAIESIKSHIKGMKGINFMVVPMSACRPHLQGISFPRERGLAFHSAFIDEARHLQTIADQMSGALGRDVSLLEVGTMIERLNTSTEIASRSWQNLTLEIKSLELTARDLGELNDYDPPKNYLYNTPPRQKKDRNRPDKITLARRKKRKR